MTLKIADFPVSTGKLPKRLSPIVAAAAGCCGCLQPAPDQPAASSEAKPRHRARDGWPSANGKTPDPAAPGDTDMVFRQCWVSEFLRGT